MRDIIETLLTVAVVAIPFACEGFTASDSPSDREGAAGTGGAGGASASAGADAESSTGTGAPCSDSDPCGACAHCEADVCVADATGTACAEGICDGAATCTSGEVLWVRAFGQTGKSTMGRGIDVDGSGAVFFAGYYLGANAHTLAFDEHEVGTASANGDANIFLVALDAADGAVTWAADIGAGSDLTGQFADTLVADRARGGAWIGGHYAGAFTFGDWSAMSSNGGNDVLVGRVSGAGAGEQAFTHHDTGAQEVWSLADDGGGAVAAAGVNKGRIATDGSEHVADSGQDAAFALLLDATGQALWVGGLDHTGADRSHGHGIAITSDAVWLGGSYIGSGSVDGTMMLPASGGTENAMLARFVRSTGEVTRLSGWGTADDNQAIGAIAAAPEGIVVAGGHAGPFSLDAHDVQGSGVFVAWVDGAGDVVRAVAFEGTGTATVHDVAVDEGGAVVVAGSVAAGNVVFGDVTIESTGERAFVAKIAADAQPLWAHGSDGQTDGVRGVAVVDGAIYVTGHTDGGIFGSSPEGTIGAHDVFVARLAP